MQQATSCAAFCLFAMVGLWAIPQPTAAAGHEAAPGRSIAVLRVALFNASDLTGVARNAFVAETQRIWAREGVRIDWSIPCAISAPGPAPQLRILLVQDGLRGTLPPSGPYSLAEFRRTDATVLASAAAAQRVVDVGLEHVPDKMALRARRFQAVGLVLGRAVAHEIGHYLLGQGHARTGLMRSAFSPAELVDPRDGIFELDRVDAARLAARLDDCLIRGLVDPPRNPVDAPIGCRSASQ
jgi:hypothetical protein